MRLMNLLTAVLMTLAACVALTACQSQPQVTPDPAPEAKPASAPATAAADVLPNDGTRAVGDVTACPVSGKVFTVSADSPKAEHEGGTYYFCCPGCVKKFQADPAKFTAKKAE